MSDLFVTLAKSRSQLSMSPKEYPLPIAKGNDVWTEALLITSNSQTTSVAAGSYRIARLHATAACFVQVGASPTATVLASTDSTQGVSLWYMAAGDTLDIELEPTDKIAVIAAA